MSSLFRTFSPTRADCPSRWTARPSVLLLPVAPNLRLTKPSHKQRSTLSSRSNQDQLSSSGRVKCFAAMHRSVTGAWEGVAFLGLEIELAPGYRDGLGSAGAFRLTRRARLSALQTLA